MSLGDLVSLSYRKLRQNFSLYWRALIMPSLGAALGTDGAFYAFFHWVKIASKSMLAVGPFAGHMAIVMVCICIWGYSLWQLMLRAGALMRMVLGLESDFAAACQTMKSKSRSTFIAYNVIVFPPLAVLLFWTFIAFSFVSFIPIQQPLRLIIGSLGFGLIGFSLTVSVALCGLFGALLIAVIAAESGSFNKSLERTIYFFKARTLRGGSFMCLSTMSLVAVYIACFSPVFLIAVLEHFTRVDFGLASRSLLIQALDAVLDTAFNVVSISVAFTGYGLFYRDLCLRLEGQDLLSKIDKLS